MIVAVQGSHPANQKTVPTKIRLGVRSRAQYRDKILTPFCVMEPDQHKESQKAVRNAVSARLREFYDELKAIVQVDADDFYRRVMEQSKPLRNNDHHA